MQREEKQNRRYLPENIPNILSINFLNLNPSSLRESHIATADADAADCNWLELNGFFRFFFCTGRGRSSLTKTTKTTTALSSSARLLFIHTHTHADKTYERCTEITLFVLWFYGEQYATIYVYIARRAYSRTYPSISTVNCISFFLFSHSFVRFAFSVFFCAYPVTLLLLNFNQTT